MKILQSKTFLREAALMNKPWELSTGPRTAAGKAVVAENGRKHRKGEISVRERRAAVADVSHLFAEMAALRRAAMVAMTESR